MTQIPPEPMTSKNVLDELVEQLALERIEENLFRGQTPSSRPRSCLMASRGSRRGCRWQASTT